MSDDDVIRAVRDLALADDYRDLRCERAEGPEPKRPEPRADGTVHPRAMLTWWNHRPERRQVMRGSPGCAAARERGLLESLPPLVPASVEDVDRAEEAIALPLPRLLRRLYLEIGNGGFGPGDGIMGVEGGAIGEMGNLVQTNVAYLDEPGYRQDVPDGLLWFHDWGCVIASLIDCHTPDGLIWHWDPNQDSGEQLKPTSMNLADWFTHWIAGRLDVGLPERPSTPLTGTGQRATTPP